MPLTLRLLLVLWTVSIDSGGVSANVPMLKYRLMLSATLSFIFCSFFTSKIHFRDCLSKQRVYTAALFLSSPANKVSSKRYLLSTRNNVAKVFRFFYPPDVISFGGNYFATRTDVGHFCILHSFLGVSFVKADDERSAASSKVTKSSTKD